ncbi:hypothetical protein Pfo_012925 [Paulownia fortunei]|nr:hypothetical protein Pfo_012925 [Paulownia fortunei]
MDILSTPPSQTPLTTRKFHFSILPKCIPRFAAFPFTVILLLSLTSSSSAAAGVSYSAHCDDIVRDPPLLPDPNPPLPNPRFLALRHAHIDCSVNNTNKDISVIPRSLSFSSHKVYRTQNDAVFKIEAVLSLIGVGYSRNFTRRGLRLVHFRPPRIPVTSGGPWNSISFSLSGFWDSISGNLCMIGSGFGKLSSNHVVLKLDYLNSSSIFSSLVNGTLESLDLNSESGLNLKLISILGVNLRNYKYELIDKESESNGFWLLDDMANVSLGVEDLGQKVCQYIISAGIVELEYKNDCNSVNCNFLGRENGNFTPSVMYFNEIECLEDGRVRFLLGFGDFGHNGYRLPFEPNATLVSEGKWDGKKRRLNMVGCRIFSDWDEGFVGECLIRLSLRFPARWTLRDRSSVVGELWSRRSVNESGYFGRVTLSSIKNKNIRAAGLRYEYMEIENTSRSCANKTMQKGEGGKYPNALSSDMRFDMVVRNRKVTDLWGYSSPLFVDNRLYQLSTLLEGKQSLLGKKSKTLVISEHMQIKSFEISAEGTYDSERGHLCMIGCMNVGPPKVRVGRNSSLDCEILVDIQYPPVNVRNGDAVKGTIESTREKSDRLYFEPFEILSRSIYAGQAKESIWRMDLEITMVLVSNTLSCIFLGLQLLHVRRHADMLPLISVIMVIVLTLGHLIPLLLNFEALFTMSRSSVNVYFDGDGWLEVNEVLVRVITMIAFLLEFRLLQMAWSARSAGGSQKNLWISDKKVLYLSLPMYIGGGLIAWFVHLSRKSYQRPLLRIRHLGYKQQSLWSDLKTYAGLILDGFLLPQILFNLFSNSKEKALAPSFYVGTTFVRLLPHAYDLYRSHSSTWSFSYIYANPRLDYYSTAWDIIISVGGLLFVVLIYLQQRYGGQCLLPKGFWQRSTYEKVPVASPE